MKYDVIIIGSGPAGLTAGIYSGRADLKVLVLEGIQPGGQLTTTTHVENFPGFPESIMGAVLMNNMRTQAQKFNAETKFEQVTSVNFKTKPFEVKTDSEKYLADTVIIATGSKSKNLGLPNESELTGRGVSVCATCDGFFFKEKEIVVVGGGDSAMEEANFLSTFAKKVTIVYRGDKLKASAIMQDKARANPKITILMNKQISEILGTVKTGVKGIKIKDSITNKIETLNVQGIFLAIGHTPNTELFKGQISLDEAGYIITEPDTSKTNIPGVFACGDVKDRQRYWQAITSAASGCIASLDAQRYLAEREEKNKTKKSTGAKNR